MKLEELTDNELDLRFKQFVREKRYVANVSPKTVTIYLNTWTAFRKYSKIETPRELSKPLLIDFVIGMREANLRPTYINITIRTLNTFLRFLRDNEDLDKLIKLDQLKEDQRVRKVLDDDYLRKLIAHKPGDFIERRVQTMILFIVDTGARINEILTLTPEHVDLDMLTIKVLGKGSKERVIPISLELRKIAVQYIRAREKFCRGTKPAYFFCTRYGTILRYDNLRGDYEELCEKLGVERKGAFHAMRHTFATNYVRSGGNVLYLQRVLGHADVSTTRLYVEVDPEALHEVQARTAILGKLRR
jgi:integrase/recombinase XerD